jgi:hypothetical protein
LPPAIQDSDGTLFHRALCATRLVRVSVFRRVHWL